MDGNGEITEKTIISITVGKNTLEEMQWSRSQSQKKSKVQYLDVISKMTE